MDHNAQGRRPHFHRGRRGSDRRGGDRRTLPQQTPDQGGRTSGEHVDVEQIMRDIRARIAQRHGIELSTQQIQELAARRLEAVLDPRSISPALVEQLRKGAATPVQVPMPDVPGGYAFEDTTLYESHRGVLRFLRRLFNPILKLFFNPNPLIHALHTQAKLNQDAAAREAERERRQAEWNALQYEIVNRLVTEVSRVSIEMQALSARVESLATRVDYNDRRVRTIETTATQPRQQPREHQPPRDHQQPRGETPSAPPSPVAAAEQGAGAPASGESPAADGAPRRKRRRRRGRRGGTGAGDASTQVGAPLPAATPDLEAPDVDVDDGDDEEGAPVIGTAAEPLPTAHATAPPETAAPSEPTPPPEPVQPSPPPDEPVPAAPVDHPDPGPPDR